MKEEYLHFAFEKKIFGSQFHTQEGLGLEVLDFGELNKDAGPDFLDAKIAYKGAVWAGPIEFHVKSSDWYLHGHQNDPNYDNVIAHFVYENDAEVSSGNYKLPTVSLKDKIDPKHFRKYKILLNNKNVIPCANQLGESLGEALEVEKERAIVARLWRKSVQLVRDIEMLKGDREKAFLIAVSRVFGGKVNCEAFSAVIEKMELRWLSKLNYDQYQLEALFLGVANLLPLKSDDNYIKGLISEFDYQKKLFGIEELSHLKWRYATMRPISFPEIKMVQLVSFLINFKKGSAFFEDTFTVEDFKKDLNFTLNDFWAKHYTLKREAKRKFKTKLSGDKIDLIVINAIVPFIYSIGLLEGNEHYKSNALRLLKEIKAENNTVIRRWKEMKIEVKTAYDSQSLLEIEKWGCNRKKCLFCAVGKSILNR